MGPSTAKIPFFQIILPVVGLFCLFCSIPMFCEASEALDAQSGRIIVLDPGHGGDDFGAKGEKGTLEKDMTLTLAQALANHLRSQFKVLLTRNDDHHLPIPDRTSLANHHKADLFVSLHLGGSFTPETNACLITYYSSERTEKTEWNNDINKLSNSEEMASALWNQLQLEHIPTSRRMAESLQRLLLNQLADTKPMVDGSSLYVLEGATMPAILIEPFYITHPNAEAQYQSPRELEKLAQKLAHGISMIMEN